MFNSCRSILSSFYRYAISHEVLPYNLKERVKWQKADKKDAACIIKAGLAQIASSTLESCTMMPSFPLGWATFATLERAGAGQLFILLAQPVDRHANILTVVILVSPDL